MRFALCLVAIVTMISGRVECDNSSKPCSQEFLFPKNFIFGASSAAYQVEGGWNADGKGPSIWDNITHENPDYIADRENGDIASDSYHAYKQDVQLLKNIGMYRFSISWPRVLPDGRVSNINQAGIKYYMNLIDDLLANGIAPMVTLYHWDLPQALEDNGGWMNPDIAQIFTEYADLMFQTFGDKVKWWITINEAYMVTRGYGDDYLAPAAHLESSGIAEYVAGHNILRAHGKAYRLYREKYSHQGGKLSMSFAGSFCIPLTNDPNDIAASERCRKFTYGWFTDPIFIGDYPSEMRRIIDKNSELEGRQSSRLPSFTKEEIEEIKGSADFFGLNHYTTSYASEGFQGANPSNARDAGIVTSTDPSWPSSAASWLKVFPAGLRLQLNQIKEEFNNPLVIVTENGYADDGLNPTDDPERIAYYKGYLSELRRAIYEDGCNVGGHVSWSLIDNLEWRSGYTVRFGLVSVDIKDPARTRTMKKSAYWIKRYIHLHKVFNTFKNLIVAAEKLKLN